MVGNRLDGQRKLRRELRAKAMLHLPVLIVREDVLNAANARQRAELSSALNATANDRGDTRIGTRQELRRDGGRGCGPKRGDGHGVDDREQNSGARIEEADQPLNGRKPVTRWIPRE